MFEIKHRTAKSKINCEELDPFPLSGVGIEHNAVFGSSVLGRSLRIQHLKWISPTGSAPTPPPIKKENTDGVLPRAARGGNPFQMLNPKAPPQYGRAEDSVVLDPDTGKWKGIKLFTINF